MFFTFAWMFLFTGYHLAAEKSKGEKLVYWYDYLIGLYTVAEAMPLVQITRSEMHKFAELNNDDKTDDLLIDVLRLIKGRIPDDLIDEYQHAKDKTDWLGSEKDAPKCKKEKELCEKLQVLKEQLGEAKVMEGYATATELKGIKGALEYRISQQLILVADLAMLDMSTPEMCVPIWSPGSKLTLKEKLSLVDGALAIFKGIEKPKNVKEACKKLGMKNEKDMECLYALTSIGYQPVAEALEGIKNAKQKAILSYCLRGLDDPCRVASEGTPDSKRLKRMYHDFEERCKWQRGAAEIVNSCPDPKASLPLARSLEGLDETTPDIARDERWFWMHVYTGQYSKARQLYIHLESLLKGINEHAVFALQRMKSALPENSKSVKISGLRKAEGDLGVVQLLLDGKIDEAKVVLEGSLKNLSTEVREYYDLLILMFRYPRVLELSGVVSKALLSGGERKENLRMMRLLDQVAQGKKLKENLSEDMAALLYLLAGRYEEALSRYEPLVLEGTFVSPQMSELMATCRICQATRESLCSPIMNQHVNNAINLLHLRAKEALYQEILPQLCKKAGETQRSGGEDVNLFRMKADWDILFGHTGRLFKFPRDPEEGVNKDSIVQVIFNDKREAEGTSDEQVKKKGPDREIAEKVKDKRKTDKLSGSDEESESKATLKRLDDLKKRDNFQKKSTSDSDSDEEIEEQKQVETQRIKKDSTLFREKEQFLKEPWVSRHPIVPERKDMIQRKEKSASKRKGRQIIKKERSTSESNSEEEAEATMTSFPVYRQPLKYYGNDNDYYENGETVEISDLEMPAVVDPIEDDETYYSPLPEVTDEEVQYKNVEPVEIAKKPEESLKEQFFLDSDEEIESDGDYGESNVEKSPETKELFDLVTGIPIRH